MLSDVPQKGVTTLYGLPGEVFLRAAIGFLFVMFVIQFLLRTN